MDADILCLSCQQQFNETTQVPLIILDCGHTVCKACLEKFNSENTVLCVECNEEKSNQNFVVNHLVLKMIKRSNKKSRFNTDTEEILNNSFTATDTKSILSYSNSVKLYTLSENTCDLHNQILDVYCMTCKCKICNSCGLFGNHKNHQLASHQELQKSLFQQNQELENLLEQVDQANFLPENIIEEQFKVIYDKLQSQIQKIIEEIINQIEKAKQEWQKEGENQLKHLEGELKSKFFESCISIQDKISLWKISAKDKYQQVKQFLQDEKVNDNMIFNLSEFNSLGKSILSDYQATIDFKDQIKQIQKIQVSAILNPQFYDILKGQVSLNTYHGHNRNPSRQSISLLNPVVVDIDENFSPVLSALATPINRIQDEIDRYSETRSLQRNLNMLSTSRIKSVNKSPMQRSLTPKTSDNKIQNILKNEYSINTAQLASYSVLKDLDFHNKDLGDKGVVSFSKLLKYCTNLSTLNLSRNKITDQGVISLFTIISKLKQVKLSVNLSNNHISDKGLEFILQSSVNGTLKQVNLGFNLIKSRDFKWKKKFEQYKQNVKIDL